MATALVAATGAVLLIIHSCSYAQCREDENIQIYEYDGAEGTTLSNHDSSLNQMIFYDDSYVYVDREAFEAFLKKAMQRGRFILSLEDFINFPVFYAERSHVYMKPIQRMR